MSTDDDGGPVPEWLQVTLAYTALVVCILCLVIFVTVVLVV